MMEVRQIWPPQKGSWDVRFGEENAKVKALQHGKGAIGHLEELVEARPVPFEPDLAHPIRVFECGPHAPKSTAGNVFDSFPVIFAMIVEGNWQRARQDCLDMARFFRSHGDA